MKNIKTEHWIIIVFFAFLLIPSLVRSCNRAFPGTTSKGGSIENVQYSGSSSSKSLTIEGFVLDLDYGEPMIGANIILEKSNIGTISDMDGHFILEFDRITTEDPTLIFSYIGYKQLEFRVDPKKGSYCLGRFLMKEL